MIFALPAAWTCCEQATAAREIHFTVPEGFVVDRPSELQGSLLSLTFGPDGSAYIGRESGGIVRLSDIDRDDRYERFEEVANELQSCQGLLVEHGSLWAVGMRDGKSGLWRVPLGADGLRSGDSERVFEFSDGGEHGPHAIVAGPDCLYLMVGNHAAFGDAREHLGNYWAGDEGRLLAPYMDPLGFGTQVRYPAGFVARVDLVSRTWRYFSVGLRNAYDLAIDGDGRMFTVDSDMEWDVGLPWYRPVRFLELIEGADYGSRAGSGVIPDWCVDTEPALLELGRGSPTGAVFGWHAKFPLPWALAMFSGDWSQGRILAIWPAGRGGNSAPESSDFLRADAALPVTDLAIGPDGWLWFLTGGRGAQGGVFRVGQRDISIPPRPRAAAVLSAARLRLALDARHLIEGKPAQAATNAANAFRQFDGTSWPLELRVFGAIASEADLDALSRSNAIEQRVAALLVLGSGHGIGRRAERIVSSGLALLDDLVNSRDPRKELTLAVLRALELGLLRQGDPSPELAARLVRRLLAMFPDDDPRIASEVGVLLSHLDDEHALGPLMNEMQKSPQELAIHFCDCAHRMTHGWDTQRRRAMLDWFARSRDYKGGVSLPGYLTAMRARFIANLPAAACDELAPLEGIDAESLALLFARLPVEKATELFPRFEASLTRIVPTQFGTREQIAKDAALRALEGLKLPAIEELARKLARTEGDVLEAPWSLLARTSDERDYDLWLGAIVSASAPKREAAIRALSSIARKPKTAEEWRSLLDQAHELGARRGRELTRTLARWSSTAAGDLEKPADFDAALAAVESWYRAQFPDGPPPTDPEARPHWSEAQMLAFLERAKSRPGSAAHGRVVFDSASCNTCHALGRSPAIDSRGFGPDLANVTDRLTTADLLAAIVAPSRAISDQYRAFVARTRDERQFEGVVTRRDAKTVMLQPVGAAAIEIDADELESLEPSARSLMPEGLFDSRTLEEIRDLFAYLKSPEVNAPPSPWSPLLGRDGIAGWNGDSSVWSLRATTIVGRSSGLSRSSYLLAKMPAQDLLIEFDVFLPPGGNSGLCYRAERPSDLSLSDPSGLQADLGQSYWGSLYAANGTTLAAANSTALESALDRNGWNHVLVRFQGDRHSMEINGLETYDTHAEGAAGSQLGFQVHQGKPMLVRIANARWRAP